MNISPNFSPPLKLMQPYFLLSGFFYMLSMIWIFFLDFNLDLKDFILIGWVHLFMLGFIMMAIFASMAQLGVIVVETNHYYVDIFKYVWVFLTSGLMLMLIGFYIDTSYLIYGGVLVLIAMCIYAIEFLLTLKTARRKTSITNAMKMSNFFLLLGILTGLVMAFSFNGYIEINPHTLLNTHTFGLVVGFVIMLIMGISIILIPMFGFSKRLSDNEFKNSFITLSIGVSVMMISPIFLTNILQNIAYIITICAVLLYFYQLYKMHKSRKKVVHDIWAISMYVSFTSFIISFVSLVSYLFLDNEIILRFGLWLMLIGFFSFIIIGNFYKVIPFLIWFQIYSPLIEEQAVPMLHELLPKRIVFLQWFYSTAGLLLSSVAILIQNTQLFYGGITMLSMGSVLFFLIILKIIKTHIK
ncbi:MAG: hypothetical protein ABGW74_02990 [Campylobacterales bacterium]